MLAFKVCGSCGCRAACTINMTRPNLRLFLYYNIVTVALGFTGSPAKKNLIFRCCKPILYGLLIKIFVHEKQALICK